LNRLLAELKRRNVLRVAAGYFVTAWLVVQVAGEVLPPFGFGYEAIRLVILAFAIGFIPVLVFTWAFEWTPQGVRRDIDDGQDRAPATRKFDRVIMLVLALAVAFFVTEKVIDRQPPPDATIAVLPFVNMSSDSEQDFFSGGVAEDILTLLTRKSGLNVIPRSISFAYGGEADISTLAEELDVSYVLAGSVRTTGDKIRVTAQLTDANSNRQMWSESYDRDLTDIFDIQDDVSRLVTEELLARLIDSEQTQHRTDPATYAIYLQARHVFQSAVGDVSDKATSIRLLEQVFERDPEFVPAMTLYTLVQSYDALSGDWSDAEREEKFQLAEKYAVLSYATDPNDAVANAYHAYGLSTDGELQQAANIFERALQLDASEREVLRLGSMFAGSIGHFEKSAELALKLIERHPLCMHCYPVATSALRAAGHFDEAEAVLRQRINLINDTGGHYWLGVVLVEQGRPLEALEIFDRNTDAEWDWLTARSFALHDLGRHNEVQEMLNRIIAGWGDEAALMIAEIFAYANDVESALTWLETAFSDDPSDFTDVVWNTHFAVLHDTAQWQKWLAEMDPSIEVLAAIEFDIP